jgi:glycosyltransferase involved in cell wall biosynthesis
VSEANSTPKVAIITGASSGIGWGAAKMFVENGMTVVGVGRDQQRLEQLAAELGIGANVEFTGPVPQARLAEIYAGADLFVLGSVIIERSGKRDVIPNVLAEAMAMRLPVVATSVSGITELVTDGVSGRLVAPNDPAALAQVIAELLDDLTQRQRLAAEGAATVARMFDREVNIEELAALFRGAAGAARGAA